MRGAIYLDNQATTRLDPRALKAMLPFLEGAFGNPASLQHELGRVARAAVERARSQVGTLIGAHSPHSIVFTSGATESNNLVVKGIAQIPGQSRNHIVASAIEHPSVNEPCRFLEQRGWHVTLVQPDSNGVVDPAAVLEAVDDRTALVTLMMVNNEIGTIQPVGEVVEAAHSRGVLVHTDATQALGKMDLALDTLGVDFASLSAHKIHGPKGVGALYVRTGHSGPRLVPQLHGGSQEDGRRAGTTNVPGVVGFGAAAACFEGEIAVEAAGALLLRTRFLENLHASLDAFSVNGDPQRSVPHSLSVTFDGVLAEDLMNSVPWIACSAGSACRSASIAPSPTLLALGLSPEQALATVRFGFARFNTIDEVEVASQGIAEAVTRLRQQHA